MICETENRRIGETAPVPPVSASPCLRVSASPSPRVPDSPELPLFQCAPDDPSSARLEELLKDWGDWLTAAEVLDRLGRRINEDGRRMVRARASSSEWIITGQRGYKHIEHATAEEINHAANWLESQAKKMGDRAGAIRRNAHRIFG